MPTPSCCWLLLVSIEEPQPGALPTSSPAWKTGPRQPLSALEQPTALRWFARMCSRTSVANQCCSTTFELTIWKAPKMEVPPNHLKSDHWNRLKHLEIYGDLGIPFKNLSVYGRTPSELTTGPDTGASPLGLVELSPSRRSCATAAIRLAWEIM